MLVFYMKNLDCNIEPALSFLPAADPSAYGLCPKRLRRVSTVMQSYIDRGLTAGGITLVTRRNRIVHYECHGLADTAKKKPMTKDTLFRLYSMSKPVTAVAVLMLYEETAFFLDEPVKKFLPEFSGLKVKQLKPDGSFILVPPHREVTIHDLLTHTGGLTYEGFDEAEERGMNLKKFVKHICRLPLTSHPGEKWQYSVSNDILGRLVEVVSGQTFDKFLEKRLFGPLGMKDTGFFVPKEKQARLAALYTHDKKGRLIKRKTEDRNYLRKPVLFSGGAGLVSTAADYLRFSQMLLNNGMFNGARILGRKTVELMRADHLPPVLPCIEPYKFGYGLGVSVLRSVSEKQGIGSVGEFGWGGAASTEVWIDPLEEMVTLVMMQLIGSRYGLTKQIKDAVYQAIV